MPHGGEQHKPGGHTTQHSNTNHRARRQHSFTRRWNMTSGVASATEIRAGPAAHRKSSHCTELRSHSQRSFPRKWCRTPGVAGFPHCRPSDHSVGQAAASHPRHCRPHRTHTALLQADAAFACAPRYRGLSAHGVRGSGATSRHTLLPQVCLDAVFPDGHFWFQTAAAQVISRDVL